MLAYLFWHAAPDGAVVADYEKTTEFALIGPPDISLAVPQGWSALEVERRRLGPRRPGDPAYFPVR